MGASLSTLRSVGATTATVVRKSISAPVGTLALVAILALMRRRRKLYAVYVNVCQQLWVTVNKNALLQGIAIPSVIGYILYLSRSLFNAIYQRIAKHFYCTISISSKDENFTPIVDFVAKLQADENTLLVCETRKKKWNRKDWINAYNGIGTRSPPTMEYRPTRNGTMTSFRFRGHRIMMWRQQGETITTGYDRTPLELEELTLATFAGNTKILKDLISEALMENFREESDETKIFVLSDSWAGGWEKALTKKPRPKESIVLDGDLKQHVLEDARQFLSSKAWYRSRGIPYRRGYLLHGPPGCGKTSFCQVLAGEFQLDMCMLSLSNEKLNDAKLASYFRDAPENSIILLEDVDAVFVDRDVKKEKGSQGTGVSFSGLLNAIDGVASQEGRLFFMTSNYPEKLDSALVRPGRCDIKVELKRASRKQIRNLFLRFFEGESSLANEFASKLPEFELSMAQLQGHLLEHRGSASGAVTNIPKLLRASKPQKLKKQTVHDHLRRVGLERLAPLFMMHGYSHKSDLNGLNADTVQEWDVELQYNISEKERLSKLLKGDKRLLAEDYPLASITTIRDAFTAAYSDVATEECSQLEKLTKCFTEKLSKNGRGNVSLWQLRWLLSQNSAPEKAVQNANSITQSKVNESASPKHMSCFEFLCRACCSDEWYKFEDAGYRLASELKTGFKDQKAIQQLKVPCEKAKLLNILIKNESKDRNITCGLLCPNRRQVEVSFRKCFPRSTQGEVDGFSSRVTTTAGYGLVSQMQIQSFLYEDDRDSGDPSTDVGSSSTEKDIRRFSTPAEAVRACDGKLVNIPKKSRPLPPIPSRMSAWIHKALALEDKRLARYSRKFIEARLSTRQALLADPPLKTENLKSLGVDKLGDQRQIMQFLQRLRDGGDDGVLKNGDALSCAFGNGIVVQHRKNDDVYEIDLGWGKMFAFEEKSGIKRKKPTELPASLKNAGDGAAASFAKYSADAPKVGEGLAQNLILSGNSLQAQEYKEH